MSCSPISSAKGIALKETPHPSAQESNADLNRLLEAAIPETAEQITAFFQAISAETPVPRWFDRDFKGNPPPIPQRIRWQDKRRPRIVGAALSHWASNRKVTGRSPSVQHTTLTPSRRCQGV